MATTTQIPWPRSQHPPWKIWSIANRCPGHNYLQTTALLSRTSGDLHPGDTVLKAVVLYDFKKSSRDEIAVLAKEEVLIIKNTDADWWYVLHPLSGEEGYVPATYLEVIGTMIWSGPAPTAQKARRRGKGMSLLDLPYELRCILYEYTFINTVIPFGPDHNLELLNLGLPFVNKQLYTESLSYYYNFSSFDGRLFKTCMQWSLLLPQSTQTFINHMRIRLQNSASLETRQNLFHATLKVLENEGVVVRPVILNMVLSSASRNMKILPRHVLRDRKKREESGPSARWTCSGTGWVRCKKYSAAKVRQWEKIVVVCDRLCCMPQWMLEAREIVELFLRRRKENEKFREWKGEVLVELRGRFEEEKSGRAGF